MEGLTWDEFEYQMAESGVLLTTEPYFDLQPVIRTEKGDCGIAACHIEKGKLIIDMGRYITNA